MEMTAFESIENVKADVGNVGVFRRLSPQNIFSWRQVSVICGVFPICCLVAVIFIPESPSWLLSKNRPKDAQRSLQWLRGWVSPQTVHREFTELQNYSNTANACVECSKKSIRCYHSNLTISERIKELRRYRNMKPLILMILFYFFRSFSLSTVWDPYMIQILRALGTPINPNLITVLINASGVSGCILMLLALKVLGRRIIYLTSISLVAGCSITLSIYGFIFFPSGWISFKRDLNDVPLDSEYVRNIVGNYGYLPLILILIMKFSVRFGIEGIPVLFVGEIFPYKTRSLLCGTALEDIELHYSDPTKGLKDIHIAKKSMTIGNTLGIEN